MIGLIGLGEGPEVDMGEGVDDVVEIPGADGRSFTYGEDEHGQYGTVLHTPEEEEVKGDPDHQALMRELASGLENLSVTSEQIGTTPARSDEPEM